MRWYATSRMKVQIYTAQNYLVKVEYRIRAGSWHTIRDQTMCLTVGENLIVDNSFVSVAKSTQVTVRWTINDGVDTWSKTETSPPFYP